LLFAFLSPKAENDGKYALPILNVRSIKDMKTIFKFHLIIFSILISSNSYALQSQIIQSPDGVLKAKIITIGKLIENKIEIYRNDELLNKADYSSEDGEHGQYIENASWTPDSRFFVYSTYNTCGHRAWQSGFYFYRRSDNKILPSHDYLPPIADSNFILKEPDLITLTIWSPFKSGKGIKGSIKLPITFKLIDIKGTTIEE